MAKVKLMISVSDALLERVDRWCSDYDIPRSVFFSLAASEKLNQELVKQMLQQLSLSMKRIADNGCIDDESKRKLEEFQVLVELLNAPAK